MYTCTLRDLEIRLILLLLLLFLLLLLLLQLVLLVLILLLLLRYYYYFVVVQSIQDSSNVFRFDFSPKSNSSTVQTFTYVELARV